MGTKPAAMLYTPTLRVFAAFEYDKKKTPEVRMRDLGKVVDDTLKEYPWHTDYQFVRGKEGWKFERTKNPVELCPVRITGSTKDLGNDSYEFELALTPIKESQQISVVRYGEMFGKIIRARCYKLNMSVFTISAQFHVGAYEVDRHLFATPGDIVERESQPGKYYYLDRITDGESHCQLIAIESLGVEPDRITTPHKLGIRPVDHIPQVSELERTMLMGGNHFGDRERLIAKWRKDSLGSGKTN